MYMDCNNTVIMDKSNDFQKGYIQGVTAVIACVLSEMDDELKDIVLNNLKLKRV